MPAGSPDYSSKAAVPNLWYSYSASVNTSGSTVTFAGTSAGIYIENLGATNDLLYSLNGGTSWVTLVPGQNKGLDGARASIMLKSSADTTNYLVEITYG